MSLGFMLQPSLSAIRAGRPTQPRKRVAGVYAPAFVERVHQKDHHVHQRARVAGVYAPAFVERGLCRHQIHQQEYRVAGVYAPAFVERRWNQIGVLAH